MFKNKKIIAIIPARGGSKGLPGKNIKILLGKPLVAWTIEQAKKSRYIDRLIVSTDYKEIADIAKKYGAEVPFLRPGELARDNSPTIDVVLHAIRWFEQRGEYFDIVILLEPTSPLRKEKDIDRAIEFFFQDINKVDSLVSVGEVCLENPFIMKKIEKGFVKPFIENNRSFSQRQQLAKTYFPYGVIYLSKLNALKKYKTFYQERTMPYLIERWQNYEIDDIYDFLSIEKIIEYKLRTDGRSVSPESKNNALTIFGENIYLKEFTEDNLYDERYHKWLRDLDVVKTGKPEYLKPIQFFQIENYVKRLWSSNQDYFFAIYFRKNDEFIGTLKIGLIDWQARTADIGILIGNKDYWGKGICKDAVSTACGYAFKYFGMRKLTGGTLAANVAMCKCFERIGFREEGIRRKQNFFEGEYVNHILYGIFKKEFYKKE